MWTQYVCVRIYVIVFQSLFVCLILVRVPESRVNWGSSVLGGGEPYSGGRCKKGCGFQKPRPFWSAVQCLGNQTADQKNSRKSWTVISLLIPDNADAICRHKLWNLRTWCT